MSPIAIRSLEGLVLKVHPNEVCLPKSDCPAAGNAGIFLVENFAFIFYVFLS